MIGCRVCDATAFKRTKGAAALAVGKLIDVYGSRLVLEAVSDYLRRICLNVWAAALSTPRPRSSSRGMRSSTN
jgi:hypothetical protein